MFLTDDDLTKLCGYSSHYFSGLSAGGKLANRKESPKCLKTVTELSQLPVVSRRGMQVCSLNF